MNLHCNVIRDLLPLYVEKLTSEESNALVKAHLDSCTACQEVFKKMAEPEPVIRQDGQPLKQLKSKLKEQLFEIITISAYAVILILSILNAFVLSPDGALLYMLLYYIFLFPPMGLICSITLSSRKGWLKWMAPLIFTLIAYVHPLIINLLTGSNFATPDLVMCVLLYFLPSFIAIFHGTWHSWLHRTKKQS